MKINARDMKQPLLKKRKPKPTPVLDDPNSMRSKCKAAGMEQSTVKHRMDKYGLTVDEAIRWTPPARSECGKAGKKNSPWARLTPGSKADT
mgnify:CR=1 FL=1